MKKLVALLLTVAVALPVMAGKPRFMVSEEVSYDDNIYLTAQDEKDSVISTTRVGAEYNTPVRGSGLKFAAQGLVGYNAYTENASKNNSWDALAQVGLTNDQLELSDKFIYTADPANNAQTDRAKRWQNTGLISWTSSRERTLGLGVTVSDVYDHYISKRFEALNRNRVNGGVQFNYNISGKTSLFAEYVFSNIDYKTNTMSNSNGNMFALGINGQVAPKVTGTLKATYAMRDYKHSEAGLDNHPDLVGYYAELTWKPTDENTVRLSGERRLEETAGFGTNRYYVDTAVSLYAAHKFFTKWTAAVTLAYDNMAYPEATSGTEKRKDDLFSVRPQLDYQFKDWLSAGVWYQFATRRSTESWAKYDRNRGGLFVRAMF